MNKSNLLHVAAAVVIQLGFGALPAYLGISWALWASAALATGFFIGVEWMQQVQINLILQQRPWPTKLSVKDILQGFAWKALDRYGDAGGPLLATALVAWFTKF